MLSEQIARFAIHSKVTAGSKIVRIIFCYGERVRMYEFVMKRLKVTETLMGVVFVRRNKVGWMLPASLRVTPYVATTRDYSQRC